VKRLFKIGGFDFVMRLPEPEKSKLHSVGIEVHSFEILTIKQQCKNGFFTKAV